MNLKMELVTTSTCIPFFFFLHPVGPEGAEGKGMYAARSTCTLWLFAVNWYSANVAIPVGAGRSQGCLEVAIHSRLSPLPTELLPKFCKSGNENCGDEIEILRCQQERCWAGGILARNCSPITIRQRTLERSPWGSCPSCTGCYSNGPLVQLSEPDPLDRCW
uniref:Uncharacterized protein n=1 Tax=Myotis myotis TaxID=51298 RepID=A0A7J7WVL3_MYOMY|nr:hypothetical protein mMyoMyo1_011870 [Myotis myotis]